MRRESPDQSRAGAALTIPSSLHFLSNVTHTERGKEGEEEKGRRFKGEKQFSFSAFYRPHPRLPSFFLSKVTGREGQRKMEKRRSFEYFSFHRSLPLLSLHLDTWRGRVEFEGEGLLPHPSILLSLFLPLSLHSDTEGRREKEKENELEDKEREKSEGGQPFPPSVSSSSLFTLLFLCCS